MNPLRAVINSATENNDLQFVLYFTGHLILWKITSWVLGLDYSFDKSSRPLSFLFPLIICLWTILQGSLLCSTKDRRKIKPNWFNYFIARVVIRIWRVRPLTKLTTKREKTQLDQWHCTRCFGTWKYTLFPNSVESPFRGVEKVETERSIKLCF